MGRLPALTSAAAAWCCLLLQVTLGTPPASALLPLPWPVSDKLPQCRVRLLKQDRRVELALPKTWIWPSDRWVAGAAIAVDCLPPCPLEEVGGHMGGMFSLLVSAWIHARECACCMLLMIQPAHHLPAPAS